MSHARTKHTGKALYAGRSLRTKENACLDCGYVMDGATGIGHRRKPRPGSISICIRCGHVMAFDGDLKFRPLTDAEVHAIAGDEQIIAAQKVRAAYQNWKLAKTDPAKFRAEAERQAALLRGTKGEEEAMDFIEKVTDWENE